MSVVTTEQEVLALEGAGTVLLWSQDGRRLRTTMYHRDEFTERWSRVDPEDVLADMHRYSNADLWTIATLRPERSSVSISDVNRRVASLDELAALPTSSVVEAGFAVYQRHGDQWWLMQNGSDPDSDYLSSAAMWEWYGRADEAIVLIWHPEETETERAGSAA